MKFIILDNFEYMLKKWRLLFLLSFLLFLVINLILPFKELFSDLELLYQATLTNIHIEEGFSVELIYFCFFFVFYILLAISLYQREFINHLDLIILRYPLKKWLTVKYLFLAIFLFIIKVVEYLIVYLNFLFHHVSISPTDFLSLFLTDYFFVFFIQITFIFFYNLFMMYPKGRGIFIVIGISLLLLIPKNIIYFKSILGILLLLGLSLLMFLILKYLLSKNSRKLIQNLEVLK